MNQQLSNDKLTLTEDWLIVKMDDEPA